MDRGRKLSWYHLLFRDPSQDLPQQELLFLTGIPRRGNGRSRSALLATYGSGRQLKDVFSTEAPASFHRPDALWKAEHRLTFSCHSFFLSDIGIITEKNKNARGERKFTHFQKTHMVI